MINASNTHQATNEYYAGENDTETLQRSKRLALAEGLLLASKVWDFVENCTEDSSSWVQIIGRALLTFVPYMGTFAKQFFNYDARTCSFGKNKDAARKNNIGNKVVDRKGVIKKIGDIVNRNFGAIMRVEDKVNRDLLGAAKEEDKVDENIYLLSELDEKSDAKGDESNIDRDLYYLGYGVDRNYGIIKNLEQKIDRNLYVLSNSLNKNFNILKDGQDRNFDSIRNNFQAINTNYQAIKAVEDKVDRNLLAILETFQFLENKTKETEIKMKNEFKKLREFVRTSKIENVTSKIITFVEFLITEQDSIKLFTKDLLVTKLEGENNILNLLQDARTPQSASTLHVSLNDIINQKFAFPVNAYDDIAFTALDLLYVGTQAYVSVMFFLVQGHGYLADHYYQKSDVEKYNKHLSLLSITLKNFVNSLNGRNGLFDKVIDIFDEVQQLYFIQDEREDVVELLSERKQVIHRLKSELSQIKNLPEKRPKIRIRYNFSKSNIRTPIGEWEDKKKVSYAVQVKDGSIYSLISDWSHSYTIEGKANPVLDIGIGLPGTERVIFRKFSDRNPEQVGIVRDSNQRKFRDVNQDLYNAVMGPNEQTSIKEIHRLLKGGADINAEYSDGRSILHAAAESGSSEIALVLMKNGADVNARDKDRRTALYAASELGHDNIIEDLIARGADVSAETNSSWTPLHAAAYKGNENVARILVENGSVVNSATQGGFTPLHVACSSGYDGIIEMLLLRDEININAPSDQGLTPLHLAVIGENLSAVKLLLRSSAINANAKAAGDFTPLHFASTAGNLGIVKQLIANNITNVNEKSADGWLPLHLALIFGKEDVALELLRIDGIDVHSKGTDGLSPLHLAAMKNKNRVVSGLIGRKALIDDVDKYNLTPLHFAAEKGHLEVVKKLVNDGNASLNVQQRDGYTPLALASLGGKLDTVKFLARRGASLEIRSESYLSLVDFAAWKGDITMFRFLENKGSDLTHALHWAAYGGELSMVKYLIEVKGLDVNVRDENGKLPIHDAAKNGNLNVVSYLVNKGAYAELRGNNGNTIMHFAALSGNLGIVKYLVEEMNVKLDTKNYDGITALYMAALSGYLRIVKYLHVKGADVKLTDQGGWTPTLAAAYAGHWLIVRLLVKDGATINATNSVGNSVLHFAARDGKSEIMHFLLANNSYDINIVDHDGRSPAFWAVSYSQFDTLRFLVDEKNADFSAVDKFGMSLLHRAALSGSLDMVKYLIDKGIDINVKNTDGKTPLGIASENGQLEIAQYLLDKGKISSIFDAVESGSSDAFEYFITHKNVSINVKNDKGDDLLHLATLSGNFDLIRLLGSMNGVIAIDDLLLVAAMKGSLKGVQTLIDNGAKPNALDKEGWTPLSHAVENGNLQIVKYLVNEGKADVKAAGVHESPLHAACKKNYLEIVKFLLSSGANVNKVDWIGRTPLHRAAEGSHEEIVKYLVNVRLADIAVMDNDGKTPLDVAKEKNNKQIIAFLNKQKLFAAAKSNLGQLKGILDEGADATAKDNTGRNLLHYASAYSRLDIVKYLVEEQNVSVYLTDSDGWTSLHHAVFGGDLGVIKYLVEREGKEIINVMDRNNQSSFHNSIKRRNFDIIKYLIDEGADTSAKNVDGETGLDGIASRIVQCLIDVGNNSDVVKYLSEKIGVGMNEWLWDENEWMCAAFLGHLADIVRHRADRVESVLEISERGAELIHYAAMGGHKNDIGFLLSIGASVNDKYSNGCKPLFFAVQEGRLEAAQFLVDKGADVNSACADLFGLKPIHAASIGGHRNTIDFLLSNGASVNDVGDGGWWTPLHDAMQQGHLQAAQFLIDEGANINAAVTNYHCGKPIHAAAIGGHKYAIEFLLNKGVNVDDSCDGLGFTSLHYAAQVGRSQAVKFLIDHGANVNAERRGKKPIHLAAELGRLKIMELLLSNGASINDASDERGWTPLHGAVQRGELEVAHFLLDRGANIDAATTDGLKPIHTAAIGAHVYEFLLSKGVNVNICSDGMYSSIDSPLDRAVMQGDLQNAQFLLARGANVRVENTCREPFVTFARHGENKILELLLDNGAGVDDFDEIGMTPLHMVAMSGHLEAAELLVDKGANINIETFVGHFKPIHIAAKYGHKNVFAYLVSKYDAVDADAFLTLALHNSYIQTEAERLDLIQYLLGKYEVNIYSRDKGGWTLLHHAAYGGDLGIVKYLVSEKNAAAIINGKNNDGDTPLDLARKFKNKPLVEYLMDEVSTKRDRRSIESEVSSTDAQILKPQSDWSDLDDKEKENRNGDQVISSRRNESIVQVMSGNKGFIKDTQGNISDNRNKLLASDVEIARYVRNSAVSPSSWINDLFAFVKDSFGKFFAHKAALPEAKSNNISSITEPIDINGTIMLVDMLLRKITGSKYISSAECSISSKEANGCALNTIQRIEEAIEQVAIISGLSLHRLHIDYHGMQNEITRKITSGQFHEIKAIVKSYIGKACAGSVAGCPGRLSLRKFNKFTAEFDERFDKIAHHSIQQQHVLRNRNVILDIDGAQKKQISFEPKTYLRYASDQCRLK